MSAKLKSFVPWLEARAPWACESPRVGDVFGVGIGRAKHGNT